MTENDLIIRKADITVLNIANRSGTATAVQQEINDNPISVFTELTISGGATQEQFKFLMEVHIQKFLDAQYSIVIYPKSTLHIKYFLFF